MKSLFNFLRDAEKGEFMSENEKGYSKIQWFFLVIFIPTIFAVILFGVILSFVGIDVIDRAKQIGATLPFVSDYLSEEEEVDFQGEINELEATITERETAIEQLQKEIEQKTEEVQTIENERNQLEQQLAVREDMEEQTQQELDEIAKTYESMSAKNAATIIAALPEQEALLHISQLSTESKAAILEKMDGEKAAELMSQLANDY
jgi:flagellar motility protein MotE (MotC chaperone)